MSKLTMRRLFSLFSVAIIALFAVGCDTPSNDEGAGSGITFKFQNAKVTATSIELQVVPSDATINYVAVLVESAEIAEKSDAQLIEELLGADDLKLKKGPQYLIGKNLKSATEYTAVAFAVSESQKATRFAIATEEASEPITSSQFDVDIEVKEITATSAVATAKPNSSANRYYFRVITKMELDSFGIYNDDYQIFEYIIENPSSGEYITQGETTLNCRLNAEMEYLAVAFNFENWEAVHKQEEPIKLFRYAFETPKGEQVSPDDLFTTSNLTTTASGFALDVTPVKGEDAYWTYYVWTKKSFDDTVKNEASANVVMRSYFGLQNLAVEQGYLFADIIKTDKLGKVGSNQITNYEILKNNTEYVVVLFYIDPENGDPTSVYDYNYVAIEFTTNAPSSDKVDMQISEPIIESTGFANYAIKFNILVDDNAVSLSKGANLWNDDTIGKYWDPSDWNSIRAFFWLYPVDEETLAQAKSSTGCVLSFTSEGAQDYVFFFEAVNAENTPTQHVVRVTPEMFANAQ